MKINISFSVNLLFYKKIFHSSIPNDKRSLVYCEGIKQGSEVEWDFVYEKYHNETDKNKRNQLLYGLSCSREPWLINKYFNMHSHYSEDSLMSLTYGLQHSHSYLITWNYIRENWNLLIQK